ncbi:hypothetical protein HZS_7077 [Henneguya salminicola]|nr:hypothetical protein HZS_7077 [Henneguya salminicola]
MECNWMHINIVDKTRTSREKNSWMLFPLEASHQKEVNKILNLNTSIIVSKMKLLTQISH